MAGAAQGGVTSRSPCGETSSPLPLLHGGFMRAFVRPWRAGVLVAVPALAILGLAGMPSLAGAATGQPPPVAAGVAAVAPGASAPVAPHFLSPLPTPALPAGTERGGASPAQAGQMQCDVPVNTHTKP